MVHLMAVDGGGRGVRVWGGVGFRGLWAFD